MSLESITRTPGPCNDSTPLSGATQMTRGTTRRTFIKQIGYAGAALQEDPQGRHPDGQPGPRRPGLAPRPRLYRQGGPGRCHGVPHVDQPPDLAAGDGPPARLRPPPG